MIKILFICHGNICRSPMAEFILKKMVREKGLDGQMFIASAATSSEEIGNPVFPGARKKLKSKGISAEGKTAVRMTPEDYEKYDYLLAMEQYNITNMMRIVGADPDRKIYRLLDFTGHPRDIADPWYTGNFDITYEDIEEGCRAFLDKIAGGDVRGYRENREK